MNRKTEGTLVLEGLLEGPVPQTPDGEERLREWIGFAASFGLAFSLEIEGGSFNLMAGDEPVDVAALNGAPVETITEALRQLRKIFPADETGRVFSTLRSVEYQAGREIQTLYYVRPGGKVDARSRTISTETAAPAKPLTGGEKTRLVLAGIGVAAMVLAFAWFFLGGKRIVTDAFAGLVPLDPAQTTVDNERFKKYFTVTDKKLAHGNRLILTLKRTKGFPRDAAGEAAAAPPPNAPPAKRLAFDAVARGYVRVELFDEKGEFIGFVAVRIRGLRKEGAIKIPVPFSRRRRPRRLVFAY